MPKDNESGQNSVDALCSVQGLTSFGQHAGNHAESCLINPFYFIDSHLLTDKFNDHIRIYSYTAKSTVRYSTQACKQSKQTYIHTYIHAYIYTGKETSEMKLLFRCHELLNHLMMQIVQVAPTDEV